MSKIGTAEKKALEVSGWKVESNKFQFHPLVNDGATQGAS